MEQWFPVVVILSGALLRLAFLVPDAEEKLARYHPIPGSYARIRRMSWVFLIVGGFWQFQNLYF